MDDDKKIDVTDHFASVYPGKWEGEMISAVDIYGAADIGNDLPKYEGGMKQFDLRMKLLLSMLVDVYDPSPIPSPETLRNIRALEEFYLGAESGRVARKASDANYMADTDFSFLQGGIDNTTSPDFGACSSSEIYMAKMLVDPYTKIKINDASGGIEIKFDHPDREENKLRIEHVKESLMIRFRGDKTTSSGNKVFLNNPSEAALEFIKACVVTKEYSASPRL